MELTCPSCSARFRIGADALPATGRRVRCGRCGHTWRQTPVGTVESLDEPESATAEEAAPRPSLRDPVAPAEAEEDIEAELEVLRRRAPLRAEGDYAYADSPAPRRGRGLLIGWLLFLIVVAALAAGAWFERERIVAEVPAAAELYALAGIEVESSRLGLELRDVTSVRRTVEGKRVLTIAGAVVNVTAKPVAVPALRASITDGTGAAIVDWEFSAAQAELPPNGITTFETQAENPPSEGQLSIVFVGVKQ